MAGGPGCSTIHFAADMVEQVLSEAAICWGLTSDGADQG